MKAAHDKLLLTLDLRAEGLRKIAADLPTALGRGQPARNAVEQIAGQMQYFLTSDVVYKARVAPLIKEALDDAGSPASASPTASSWATSRGCRPHGRPAPRRRAPARPNQPPAPGLHGHGLTSVAVGDTRCSPPVVNRVPARVASRSTSPSRTRARTTRTTSASRSRSAPAGATITARKTVAQTKAGEAAEVDIPLGQTPPVGTSTVTVAVAAVPGEQKTDNNRQNYTVIFTR